jgi:hypothetical protein
MRVLGEQLQKQAYRQVAYYDFHNSRNLQTACFPCNGARCYIDL